MTGIVVDYAWSHPTIDKLHSLGALGVVRYVSHEPSKDLSKSEYAALKNGKLAVALVWETTANRALSGYAGGVSDADQAEAKADALGYPTDAVIYYAVDFDANPAQRKIVQQYLHGCNDSSKRPVGVYGSYYVVEDAANNHQADYFWQTMAWSGGQVSNDADIIQVVEGSTSQYDINHVINADWGQDVKHYDHPDVIVPPFPLVHNVFGKGHVTSGHNLHLWQEKMSHRGWVIAADDIFGPETENVCRQFQQEKHLVVDGLIGPRTWNAAWKAPVT